LPSSTRSISPVEKPAGQLQLEVFGQPVQPRDQEFEPIQQLPQRRHSFRSRRTELVLMQITSIPRPEVTERPDNLRIGTLMAGQKARQIDVRGR
jgi:hypothetical protein